jgi:hypothetical protein
VGVVREVGVEPSPLTES